MVDPPDADLSGATILLTGGTGSFGNAFVVGGHQPLGRRRDPRLLPRRAEAVGDAGALRRPTAAPLLHRRRPRPLPHVAGRPGRRRHRARRGDEAGAGVRVQPVRGGAAPTSSAPSTSSTPPSTPASKKVVALSTDKAVNPVNLYGATKLCAEKIIVQGNAYAAQSHDPAVVRPLRQRRRLAGIGGPAVPPAGRRPGKLTITDERMTRFWITLAQAVDLVLYALDHMAGGEVFIPKIPSMRVVDLAEAMAPGLPREIIGIRPGEKLHEVLLTADESRHTDRRRRRLRRAARAPVVDRAAGRGWTASRSPTASSTPATPTTGGSTRGRARPHRSP